MKLKVYKFLANINYKIAIYFACKERKYMRLEIDENARLLFDDYCNYDKAILNELYGLMYHDTDSTQ